MKFLFTVFLIFIALISAVAQKTFQFKGQIYHNKSGPQKNISVLIDNQYPAVTNDNGIFIAAGLPQSTTMIKVSLSKSDYTILYPYSGYVLIPKDLNAVSQIIIGSTRDNQDLNQYLRLYTLIKNKPAPSNPDISLLSKKLDSLQSILINQHYTESELRNYKEIQDGKDDYLPEINGDMVDFQTKASDLKTAFKFVADYAFSEKNALEKLASSINNYNISFNKLNKQHLNYERRITDYWQNDSLRNDFRNWTSLALDTIHAQYIYPMQETIGQIRNYFIGHNKNEEIKKNIQQNISRMVVQLELLLPRLDESTKIIGIALANE